MLRKTLQWSCSLLEDSNCPVSLNTTWLLCFTSETLRLWQSVQSACFAPSGFKTSDIFSLPPNYWVGQKQADVNHHHDAGIQTTSTAAQHRGLQYNQLMIKAFPNWSPLTSQGNEKWNHPSYHVLHVTCSRFDGWPRLVVFPHNFIDELRWRRDRTHGRVQHDPAPQ